jgi:hypothetical protein
LAFSLDTLGKLLMLLTKAMSPCVTNPHPFLPSQSPSPESFPSRHKEAAISLIPQERRERRGGMRREERERKKNGGRGQK